MKDEIVPPKKGLRLCLKCNKEFKSQDLTRNRICMSCNKTNERDRTSIRQSGDSVYSGSSKLNISER